MYVQIVFRYAGSEWQFYGPIVASPQHHELYEACIKAHPTGMVGVVEAPSLADLEAKLDLVRARKSNEARSEGPRDVPLGEAGPGGDRDTPYTYTPPTRAEATHWLRLMGRVQRGELGGPLDGDGSLGERVVA